MKLLVLRTFLIQVNDLLLSSLEVIVALRQCLYLEPRLMFNCDLNIGLLGKY